MRKILLTSVGVAALAVSANATDFTLSGSSLLNIDDQGDTADQLSRRRTRCLKKCKEFMLIVFFFALWSFHLWSFR